MKLFLPSTEMLFYYCEWIDSSQGDPILQRVDDWLTHTQRQTDWLLYFRVNIQWNAYWFLPFLSIQDQVCSSLVPRPHVSHEEKDLVTIERFLGCAVLILNESWLHACMMEGLFHWFMRTHLDYVTLFNWIVQKSRLLTQHNQEIAQ